MDDTLKALRAYANAEQHYRTIPTTASHRAVAKELLETSRAYIARLRGELKAMTNAAKVHNENFLDKHRQWVEAENKLATAERERDEARESIAYALGRLGDPPCPQPERLPHELRLLADERAAWIHVATERVSELEACLQERHEQLAAERARSEGIRAISARLSAMVEPVVRCDGNPERVAYNRGYRACQTMFRGVARDWDATLPTPPPEPESGEAASDGGEGRG